jgi:hypothetical protein
MKKNEDIWRAVQDKNISYRDKQDLAVIFRHLNKLKRRLRSNKVRKRTNVILLATSIDGKGGFRPPVKSPLPIRRAIPVSPQSRR